MKLKYFLAILAFIIASASTVYAADSYTEVAKLCAVTEYVGEIEFQTNSKNMTVDDKTIPIDSEQPNGITPQVINGRTLLPARALVESLGGAISYNTGTITITAKDDTEIELTKGSSNMFVNGSVVKLDTPVTVVQSRTFVPVRAVTEALGCNVDYESSTKTVTVTQPCQTCRLVVSDSNLPNTHPSNIIDLGGDSKILVYDTVQETIEAYDKLKELEISVIPDLPISVELAETDGTWEDACSGLTDCKLSVKGGRPVIVAVIDTGIDCNSLYKYKARILDGFNAINPNREPTDGYGHGTKVSSLIAKYTNKNVEILPIKIFDDNGLPGNEKFFLSNMVSVLRYAESKGADIINMSLTIGAKKETDVIENTMNDIINNDISIVAAAGNYPQIDSNTFLPAKIPKVITVASNDRSNNPSSFSSHGSCVDLSAPGSSITVIGKNGNVAQGDGTSFSAPIVTATCANFLSEKHYTPAELEINVKNHTKPFNGSVNGFGAGILSFSNSNNIPDPNPEPLKIIGLRFNKTSVKLMPKSTETVKLTATYNNNTTKDVTTEYQVVSSNTNVAIYNDGVITAVNDGKANFTVENAPVTVEPLSVTVDSTNKEISVVEYKFNKSSLNMKLANMDNITVTAIYSDETTRNVTSEANLYSSNTSIVDVDVNGKVMAKGVGTAYISITSTPAENSIKIPAPIKVTVEDYLGPLPSPVDPDKPELKSCNFDVSKVEILKGEIINIKVYGHYTDGSYKAITNECGLISSNTNIVTVSNDGKISAKSKGTAYISITNVPTSVDLPDPLKVVVDDSGILPSPTIESYNFDVSKLDLEENETTEIKVYVHFKDGTYKIITDECGLVSSNTSIVTISKNGKVTAKSKGTAYISMSSVDSSFRPESLKVTVTRKNNVESIEVNPSSITLSLGTTNQVHATVTPSNFANSVIWESGDGSIVSVDNNGKIKGLSAGKTYIIAKVQGKSAKCDITVMDVDTTKLDVNINSFTKSLSSKGIMNFDVDVSAPKRTDKVSGSEYVLYIAISDRGNPNALNGANGGTWVELKSVFFDSGKDQNIKGSIDISKLGISQGEHIIAFSIFYPDKYYIGASLFDNIDRITIK